MLKVMATGAGKTGMVNINLLSEALGLLGWKVEERVGATPVKDTDQFKRLLPEFLRISKADTWGYPGVKDTKEFWFKTEAEAVAGAALLRKHVEVVPPKGPVAPRVGTVYVHEIGNVYDSAPGYARWAVPTKLWWVGVPAWAFSNGKGPAAVLTLGMDSYGRVADPSQMKLPSFWTWGYKNGLKEAATAFLASMGAEVVEALTRPQNARSLDGTGTCSACFENVKLTSDQIIMRHGWVVQGHRGWGDYGNSWHSAACQGFQWAPFEISKAGTENYLKRYVIPTIANMKARLRELESAPATITQTSNYGGMAKSKVFTRPDDFEPGLSSYPSLSYGDALMSMIKRTEYDLKNILDHQRTIDARIAAWEPRPLPGTR
jgi:hypothetical protein